MPTVELSSVAGFPLFASFSGEALRDLLAASQTVRLPKNGRIFTQGDDAKSFFVLLKGYVRATKTTADGDEIVVRYVSPGEMFGVAVTIGLDQYPATAVAVVDAVVLAWPSTSWPTLVAKYPGFASHALKTVEAPTPGSPRADCGTNNRGGGAENCPCPASGSQNKRAAP